MKSSTRSLIRKHTAKKRVTMLGRKGGYGRTLMAAIVRRTRR